MSVTTFISRRTFFYGDIVEEKNNITNHPYHRVTIVHGEGPPGEAESRLENNRFRRRWNKSLGLKDYYDEPTIKHYVNYRDRP